MLSIRCFDVMLNFILVHQSQKYSVSEESPDCLSKHCMPVQTLPVTTASAGRSLSKLKLTKTTLKSTMGESRLSSLLLLSIERELTDKVDFNCIIDAFL